MDKGLDKDQMSEIFEEVSDYFFLLSEPTRLKILHSLCNGERAVGAIVTEIEASQANVSRQLKMLYQARILGRRKDGAQVYYRIEDQNTFELCSTVCNQMVIKIQNNRLLAAGAVGNAMASND